MGVGVQNDIQNELSIFYFTFGSGHYHPHSLDSLGEYWIEVEASSEMEARRRMHEIHGGKWCTSYLEKPSLEDCPRGCYMRYKMDPEYQDIT